MLAFYHGFAMPKVRLLLAEERKSYTACCGLPSNSLRITLASQ